MNATIADLRRDYSSQSLLESDVSPNPVDQFEKWWDQALKSEIMEPNAMTLATASADGMPSARIVLLKGFSPEGFVFYTNYDSSKGKELSQNPRACLVFFWKELERQVRISGTIRKTLSQESDDYFLSRPVASQVGAWASPQSQVIQNRQWLDDQFHQLVLRFKEEPLCRPPHWGGYVLEPRKVEFWQGRPSRLHDRIQYSLQDNRQWKIERLAP